MSTMLIDALSARQGGGQTYLLNLLTRLPAGEPSAIHLLAPPEIAAKLASDRVKPVEHAWSENALARAAWQKMFLAGKAKSVGASLLFYPGGVGNSAPAGCRRVTMFRNVIPFEPEQRARYPLGYQRARLWMLERAMLKSMLAADLTIFLSAHARALVEGRAGRPIASSVTIPHGIAPEFRSAPRERPAWLPRGPYLLYVSAFDYYKAQLEVVRAFHRLLGKWKEDLSLVLLGPDNNDYGRLVRDEIAALGLQDRVVAPGGKPYAELPAAYHHSLIGIFASEAENCPNSLLEAMAAGKPVVCSNRAPMPEFGGDAVLYFDPRKPEDLARLLLGLLGDASARAQLGEAAARRSLRYDWDQTARATWDAIGRLIK